MGSHEDHVNTGGATRAVTTDPDRWRYARVLRPTLVFGAAAHGLFLLLFLLLEVPVLVAFNAVSILLYAALIALTPRVNSRWAVLLASAEVLAHAWLATHYIGWQSGFHFYPLILIPILAFLPVLTLPQRATLILMATGLYSAMAVVYTSATPVTPLPPAFAPWLSAANVVSVSVGMSVFILFYAMAVQNADTLVRMAQERLEILAATDPLTGLLNRRSMDHHLQQAVTARKPTALMLADIDNFKRINDEHGHDTGDRVLEAIGQALRTSVHENVAVARWGGEEFLILVPDTDEAGAYRLAERIRNTVPDCWDGGPDCPVTMSIGVTSLQPNDTAARFAIRADQALLAAKRTGRDRVVRAARETDTAAT